MAERRDLVTTLARLGDHAALVGDGETDPQKMDSVELRDLFARQCFRLLSSRPVLLRIRDQLTSQDAVVQSRMLELLLRHLLPTQQTVTTRKLVVHSALQRPVKEAPDGAR